MYVGYSSLQTKDNGHYVSQLCHIDFSGLLLVEFSGDVAVMVVCRSVELQKA